jgi:hypothetical protein
MWIGQRPRKVAKHFCELLVGNCAMMPPHPLWNSYRVLVLSFTLCTGALSSGHVPVTDGDFRLIPTYYTIIDMSLHNSYIRCLIHKAHVGKIPNLCKILCLILTHLNLNFCLILSTIVIQAWHWKVKTIALLHKIQCTFKTENSQNLGEKPKWALWMRHLLWKSDLWLGYLHKCFCQSAYFFQIYQKGHILL